MHGRFCTYLLEKGLACQKWHQWWRPVARCGTLPHGGDCVLLLSFCHEEPFFSCCLALLMFLLQSSRVQQVVSSCYSSHITTLSNKESKNIHPNLRSWSATVLFKSSKPTAIKTPQVTRIKPSKQIQCRVTQFACTSVAFYCKLLKTAPHTRKALLSENGG